MSERRKKHIITWNNYSDEFERAEKAEARVKEFEKAISETCRDFNNGMDWKWMSTKIRGLEEMLKDD